VTIMAARTIQFFMTPQEFSEFVGIDLAPLNLELIRAKAGVWTLADPDHPHEPSFLAPRGGERPSAVGILSGREGWVLVIPPIVAGKTLYMADISARPWWSDPSTGARTAMPELERLFGQVVRKLLKKLQFSVMVSSLSTHNGTIRKSNGAVYKSIGHSEGARAWLRSSGEWRKEGSRNIGYDLP
jgi:hypothetical protein